jgi:hypothetical protein
MVSMSEPQLHFTSNEVEAYPCEKCHVPMVLTHVGTVRLTFNVRTFECFNCDNADRLMIETLRVSTLSA